jgi:hypothetical protein
MTKETDDFNAKQLKTGALSISHVTRLVEFWQTEHTGLIEDGKAGTNTIKTIDELIADQGHSPWPTERCWPLRALSDGRMPIVTSGHKSVNPDRPTHNGADLFYKYLPTDPPKKIGDSGRTKDFWIPDETWAIAACAGHVAMASLTPTGFRVWIEIAPGWFIGYFHFDKLTVIVGQRVTLGQSLGRVNDNPKDTDPDHLHFELYAGNLDEYPRGSVDPEPFWRGATVLPAL